MQKLLKQVHSENHTMVTVASPMMILYARYAERKSSVVILSLHYKLDMAVPMTAQV